MLCQAVSEEDQDFKLAQGKFFLLSFLNNLLAVEKGLH